MSSLQDDDDEDVIEESPCNRYIKRKEEVKYRDVPGIDTAYLAMDTEEGVEVVWNEAVFSDQKKFKSKEEAKLKNVFEALTLIDHPNIVKFHKYWTDNGGTFNEKSGQTSPPRSSSEHVFTIPESTNPLIFFQEIFFILFFQRYIYLFY